MQSNKYETLKRGFDVVIEAIEDSDSDYSVTVSESGGAPWEIQITVDLETFADDPNEIDGSNALMDYLSDAAVDAFESERGTLGEGAGVMVARKQAYFETTKWEEWYYKFKGTPLEDEATRMFQEFIELAHVEYPNHSERERLIETEKRLVKELDILNFERMKDSDGSFEITIVLGKRHKRACYGEFADLEEFLLGFEGDAREMEVLMKVQELLDVRDSIKEFDSMTKEADPWERKWDLESAMEELSLRLLQQNMMTEEPVGAEAAPSMATDVEEMMSGIDLHEPSEESTDDVFQKAFGRQAFNEVESAEEREDTLGENRDGQDPADMDGAQMSFNTNEYVKLKREMTIPHGWGGSKQIPKGTKGWTESLYDKHGDYYLMRLEDDATLVRVRWDDISSVSKAS